MDDIKIKTNNSVDKNSGDVGNEGLSSQNNILVNDVGSDNSSSGEQKLTPHLQVGDLKIGDKSINSVVVDEKEQQKLTKDIEGKEDKKISSTIEQSGHNQIEITQPVISLNETNGSITSDEKDITGKEKIDIENNNEHGLGKKLFSLKSFFSSKNEEEESNKIELKSKDKKLDIKIEEKPDLFVNYDSDFHRNEKKILKKIRGIKMLPKTNIAFVSTLILFTAGIIAILMGTDPKTHSIKNYEANFLYVVSKVENVYNNIGSKNTDTDNITNNNNSNNKVDNGVNDNLDNKDITGTTNNDILTNSGIDDLNTNPGSEITNSGILNDTNDEGIVKEKWLTVHADVVDNSDGTKGYIYNGQTYTKEGLQDQLKKELDEDIKNKTNEYLSKMYLDK